jgi:hypothetical protein
MQRHVLEEAWVRTLAGERLAAAMEEEVLRELALSQEARVELLRDARLDGMLRMSGRCQERDGEFVQSVLDRLRTAPSDELSFAMTGPKPSATPSSPSPWEFASLPMPKMVKSERSLTRFAWVAAIAAALILGVFLLFLNHHEQQVHNPTTPGVAQKTPTPEPKVPPAPEPAPSPPPPPPAEAAKKPGVAQVKHATECVWREPKQVGDRLSPGILELLAGTATILFDDGAELEMHGPATLDIVAANKAFLKKGEVRTAVPEQAVRFTLETPTSKVVDQGTEYVLLVADSGATDIRVQQGEVDLDAKTLDGTLFDRWRIGIGGTKRIEAIRQALEQQTPPAAGAFKGVLTINGETREFTNRSEYEKARQDAMRQFEEFRQKFFPSGDTLPKPGASVGGIKGQLNLNGQKFEFDGMDAFEKARQALQKQLEQFQRQFPMTPAGSNSPGTLNAKQSGASAFQGQINLNGQRMNFDNPQAFREAQQRLFDQFRRMQQERMQKPFQSMKP